MFFRVNPHQLSQLSQWTSWTSQPNGVERQLGLGQGQLGQLGGKKSYRRRLDNTMQPIKSDRLTVFIGSSNRVWLYHVQCKVGQVSTFVITKNRWFTFLVESDMFNWQIWWPLPQVWASWPPGHWQDFAAFNDESTAQSMSYAFAKLARNRGCHRILISTTKPCNLEDLVEIRRNAV